MAKVELSPPPETGYGASYHEKVKGPLPRLDLPMTGTLIGKVT